MVRDTFKQGAVFLAFAIPFVGLIGLIAGAWSVSGEWGNAADWIQAIGSILAIVAAGYFPVRHSELMQAKRQQELLQLMRVLADESCEALWLLSNSFVMPEHEESMMRAYLQNHRERDWETLLATISQVPVAQVPPERATDLGRMREAVSFGARVAASLPEWIKNGSSHPGLLVTLRAKRDLLGLIRTGLPVIEGKAYELMVDAQARGQRHEHFLEPISRHEFKAYRRYFMYRIQPGGVPQKAQVQIVYPFDSEHPATFNVAAPPEGWGTMYQAEAAVRKKALDAIDSIIARAAGAS